MRRGCAKWGLGECTYAHSTQCSNVNVSPKDTYTADLNQWSELRKLGTNIRCSCGSGLVLRIGVAKIEFNYVWPLKAVPTDK